MPHTLLTTLKRLQAMVSVPKSLSEGLEMLSIKNRYALIIYVFILLELFFLIVLTVSQESRTQHYLDLKTAKAKSDYETVHHGFYKISEIVSVSMAGNDKIKKLLKEADRVGEQKKEVIHHKVGALLKEDFFNLNNLYFQELQFFLPNSHSYLHLNKEELFRDDLPDIYPEAQERAGDGEDLSSFHFRHPLFNDDNNNTYSVDFFVSSETFKEELGKLLDAQLHFIQDKEIPSLLEKESNTKSIDKDDQRQSQQYFFSEETMDEIARKIKSSESFSISIHDDENVGSVTFLALMRGKAKERVDYFVYFKDDPKLAVLVGNYHVVQLLGSLLIAALFIFVLIRINRRKEIADHVNEKTQELQESNQLLKERYELTLAGVGDGIWDRDLLHDTIYFSKRWKEMLGFEEDEIENAFYEWNDRVHPDDLQKAMVDMRANMAGETERYENLHRMRHKDGRWIWILDRGKTVFDDEGNAIRMLGTHTDVTEKKALEDKVAENEARLIEAQKIAHLGNWEWDLLNHKITW
ncbi:MAG: PAS domain-containing protein, partial [Sulfurimonadaceae bacterium]